jgi:signal transduction histidine kinase
MLRGGLAAAAPMMVALLLLAGLWIIYQNERAYHAEHSRAAQVQAEILAASVTAALDFHDRTTAQETADALRVSPQIQAAGVYDDSGKLFAGYSRAGEPLPGTLPRLASSESPLFQAVVPVTRSGTRIGAVYLASAVDPLYRRLSRYAMVGLLIVMTSLVLAVLGHGQAALRRANRTLEEQARSLVATNRELEHQMEERTRAEEQLRQAQKMQALGQLTGGIAHDFNNLLTVVQGSADILRRPGISEEKRLRFAKAIVDTAERAALLTGQLLAFARRQPLSPEVLDLNERVRGLRAMLEPIIGAGIELAIDLCDDTCAVEVDPGQFEAALLNIVVNARDAMPEGGTITIGTRNVTGDAAGERERAVALSVEDTGRGIDPEVQDRVFEPFYTTKTVGKGTGLGLSQVYGFAAQSGGEVRLDSELGKGTIMTMILPCSDKALPPPERKDEEHAAEGAASRILLVEDNEEVGNFAETLLGELGHAVIRARNGMEALQLDDSGAEFDLVFTDVVMPGMNGLELAGELKQRHPGVPIVLTTGYSDRIAAAGPEGFPIVLKPYRLETLASTLGRALAEQQAV